MSATLPIPDSADGEGMQAVEASTIQAERSTIQRLADQVTVFITANPGCSFASIFREFDYSSPYLRNALALASAQHHIRRVASPLRAGNIKYLYYPA